MSTQLKKALKENIELLMTFRQACIWRIKEFNYDSDRQEITIVEMMIENQLKFTKI